jgi:hypothetical protein
MHDLVIRGGAIVDGAGRKISAAISPSMMGG